MRKSSLILFSIFLITGTIYYYSVDNFSTTGDSIKKIQVLVVRAIDGDTLELENGERVRLLGINTPEKKEFYANEAINFTKQLENKTVLLEVFEKDKYGRSLGYIFLDNRLFNEEVLRNGYAHFYSYEDDKYTKQLKKSENFAQENKLGIWKESENFGCLSILEFVYFDDNEENETLKLKNYCSTLNVSIKDDATHIYHEIIKNGEFTLTTHNIWNDAGDSLFIWDKTGLLLFERY
jgi:endonuclease YncB( thermonuclease family)